MAQDSSLSGRVAFVSGSASGVGGAIGRGLATLGARTALLRASGAGDVDGVSGVDADFATRRSVEGAFASAAAQVGDADIVVLSGVAPSALAPKALASLDAAAWADACDASLRRALYGLQAANAHFGEREGTIVVVGPTLSMTGSSGLVPLATAIEGQRAMTKSAAKQWGSRGISVNWLAVAPEVFDPALEGVPVPSPPEPAPPALGRPIDAAADIAPVIAFLAASAGRVVAGATVILDGGVWMMP